MFIKKNVIILHPQEEYLSFEQAVVYLKTTKRSLAERVRSREIPYIKDGCLACFVVGEVRGKDGNYIGFVPDTVRAFMDCGMHYYNEAVLLNPVVTAHLRAERYMKSKKLAKLHQNILVFKK